MSKKLISGLTFVLYCTALLAQSGETLTVKVNNINNKNAMLRVALYNASTNFSSETKMYRAITIQPNAKKELQITFSNIPFGTYALALYQDINSNQKLDVNFVGYPKEPFGFSNNYKPMISAPTFADCAFVFSQANKTITINLIN
ncbi:MAG: hypothetical protein RL660_2290 [Bacteroidota bacterium]|jgi:uncharacterized protein (DUF2141 family)